MSYEQVRKALFFWAVTIQVWQGYSIKPFNELCVCLYTLNSRFLCPNLLMFNFAQFIFEPSGFDHCYAQASDMPLWQYYFLLYGQLGIYWLSARIIVFSRL